MPVVSGALIPTPPMAWVVLEDTGLRSRPDTNGQTP